MFVTIRSYNSSDKADYIRYRLERAGIECEIVPQKPSDQVSPDKFKVNVLTDHVEAAVEELLKTNIEYPGEDFTLKNDPNDLLHILIPVDFSEKSFEACKYAIDIALKRPVEIKFLHVWNDELDDSIAVRSSYMVEDFKRMQRNELKRNISMNIDLYLQKLHKLIEETNTGNNLLYHFTVAEGDIQKQIEEAILRYRPKLIIIGHNTDKECKFRISREVANSIIDLAYCPVYYVPQKVYYKPFNKLHVMFATNFHKEDLQSFQLLQELSRGYDTHIHCMHVVQEGSESDAREKMDSLLKQLESSKNRNLKLYSDIINDAKLLEGFNKYIKENNIDMVAFTSPEYGIWHNLFNPDNLTKIMKGSTLPLLITRFKEKT